MNTIENYVYKKEVDWSLLQEGLTLPVDNQVVFGQTMGRFLSRGETKEINLILDGITYKAKIRNVNFDKRWNRKNDALQIRYSKNGELALKLQSIFYKSYNYIELIRNQRDRGNRSLIKLPDDMKEYLAIYTTEYDDTYIFEAIFADEIMALREEMKGKKELVMETTLNYNLEDTTSDLIETNRTIKMRKLNKKIGENLKLLYNYHCQICGKAVGENYGSKIVEAHHIDYFVDSINNDASNQMIICPNHHRVIHDKDPVFNRKKLIYLYPNGYIVKIAINKHL